ncbi:MAG: RNA polymerase sigma factor [Gemmatimonadetes bacterium]|nr:RNA polymerase sigma factor [Gemmatimonadota bacterium]
MNDPGGQRVAGWIDEYGARLLNVATAMTGDLDEAEDALQEVWLIAMRRHQVLETSPYVGAWLYRVLANVVRGRRRTAMRRRDLLRRFRPRGVDTVEPPAGGTLEQEQIKERLWREIMELPDLQRQVILLRTVEGLSTEETARAIGRAQGTVKTSLHRAVKRLRARLGAQTNVGSREEKP